MWQLVGFYLGWLGGEGKGRALGVGEVKFTGQILPTAKSHLSYPLQTHRKPSPDHGPADGEVLVDGRLIYSATDLKVGLFGILPRSDLPSVLILKYKGEAFAMRRLLLKRQSGSLHPVLHGFSPTS